MVSPLWIGYVLKAALKDRLLLGYFIFLLLAVSLSIFLGSSAITEQDQFSLVFFAGSMRIVTIVVLSLFSVFFIRHAFESKDIAFLLTRPISRPTLLISYAIALSLIACLICLSLGGSIAALHYLLSSHIQGMNIIQHVLWSVSVMWEAIIIVNVALFFAFIVKSPVNSLMAVFGVYILGRLMGQMLGIIRSHITGDYSEPLEFVMQIISIITPRFDLMGQTSWLVYGDGVVSFPFVIAHGVIFSALFVTAAYVDFRKRQF